MPQVGSGELFAVTAYAVVAVGIAAAGVAALFLAVRWLARTLFGSARRLGADLGLEVLDGRRRRGEISDAEYAEGRRILGA